MNRNQDQAEPGEVFAAGPVQRLGGLENLKSGSSSVSGSPWDPQEGGVVPTALRTEHGLQAREHGGLALRVLGSHGWSQPNGLWSEWLSCPNWDPGSHPSCVCVSCRQLRFVISLYQPPGRGFEDLGVKLSQKWLSLNLRANGRPTWGWEWEKVGSWPRRPLLQGAPGLTLLRGDPSRWVSLPGFGSQGPFQRRHWWPGVGTPPQLKLRAPTLQDPQDGPSGACPSEQNWAPGCPANPFTGLAPSSGVSSEGGWQAGRPCGEVLSPHPGQVRSCGHFLISRGCGRESTSGGVGSNPCSPWGP